MKNQNHSSRFWNPYFVPSGCIIMAVISRFTSCPLWLQVILCGLLVIAIICIINKVMYYRTKRKINELDSEAMRPQRNKSFTDAYAKLLEQAPNLTELQLLTIVVLLHNYYNLNGQPPASVDELSLLNTVLNALSHENVSAIASHQLEVIKKKKEKEKSYR